MTEDDTFDALRKPTVAQMHKIIMDNARDFNRLPQDEFETVLKDIYGWDWFELRTAWQSNNHYE